MVVHSVLITLPLPPVSYFLFKINIISEGSFGSLLNLPTNHEEFRVLALDTSAFMPIEVGGCDPIILGQPWLLAATRCHPGPGAVVTVVPITVQR